jgi:phage terminase large subunit
MVVWVFQVTRRGLLILDCISREGWYFKDYLNEVNERGYRGRDFVPHDIETPNFETGRTRIEAMVDAGRNPLKVPTLSVDDGINAVKKTLRVFKQTPLHNWVSHFADSLSCCGLDGACCRSGSSKPVEIKSITQVTMDQFMEVADDRLSPNRL